MTVVLRSTILLLGDEHSSGDSPSAPQSRIDIAGEEESTEENSHSMDHLAELRRGLAELKHEHAVSACSIFVLSSFSCQIDAHCRQCEEVASFVCLSGF